MSKTGPYFHDGRFKTLDETVTFMFDFYKKKNDSKETLSDAEKRDIVAFLRRFRSSLGRRADSVRRHERRRARKLWRRRPLQQRPGVGALLRPRPAT